MKRRMKIPVGKTVRSLLFAAALFPFAAPTGSLADGSALNERTTSLGADTPGIGESRILQGGPSFPCPPGDLTGEGLPVYDVIAFGAQGTGQTNDRPAIQAAIDAASAAGGGVVFVPAGDYRIDSPLRLKSYAILKGEGIQSVIFVSGDFDCIRCVGTATDVVRDIAIRDLQLRGTGKPSAEFATLIAMARYVEHAVIERCVLADAGYDAWYALHDCSNIKVLNNHVVNALDDGLNPGGQATGIGTHDVLICGNRVESVAHDGIHISNGTFDVIARNNTVMNCGNGVGLFRTSNSHVVSNVITGCDSGIRTVSPPTPNMRIAENQITDSAEYGIFVSGNQCEVEDNLITGGSVGIEIRSFGGIVADNTIAISNGKGIVAGGGPDFAQVRILRNSVHTAGPSTGIWIDVSCSVVAHNFVRDATLYSIFDSRGYNRVVANEVNGTVVSLLGDVNCDEAIDLQDLLDILASWGFCGEPTEDCPADLTGDGVVSVTDLLIVFANWGL